jgi:uncharacterized membrane protein YfcA
MQFHLIRSKTIVFFQRTSFGILLALIQLGLVFLGIPHFSTTSIIIAGLVLYFVIPCLASLRASRQSERTSTGVVVGSVTGITSATIIMFVLFILAAIALTAPAPAISTSGRFVPIPLSFVVTYVIVLAFFLNLLGVLLAMIGGGLGGFIGRRWLPLHK